MDFDLTSEQEMLRKMVRDFSEEVIAPQAEELDEKEEFSYDITQKMAELGLFGITVSPEYGGQGLDYLSYILVIEELARVSASQAATVAASASSTRVSPCQSTRP